MKIVHVTQPVDAGVASVVLDLATDQQARGWDVAIACPPAGWLVDRAREAEVEVHAWSARREPGVSSVAETFRLRRLLDRLDPDVVHLHSSKAGLAGRLALRGRLPTLFQPHLWSFESARGLLRLACRGWERAASRWTHQLICVSDDELVTGRAAAVHSPAAVVCNGVDTERLRPGSRVHARRRLGLHEFAPTAVCVGRLAWLKGQDQLLTAWPRVLAAVPSARLVLVGAGPMGRAWRETHPIAGDGSVLWQGHEHRTADFYTAADVVVLPSRAEGMALVPLEAMASGRPVVAFDVGGVRQSLWDAGAVVPAGDIAALAAGIASRLADPALAISEGLRARRRAEELFDRCRMGEQTAVLVEKLVDDRSRG
ncbi:glycosyltransferase [Amycolatopsis anabasis]|uniref:glycosyltransferase n=1 Tax=Amycolatopsis anabasis TaxID=1840409 RepID=UPI00131B6602|nr:glycosyltransferase [Amycolatopsis anabasis]